MALTLDLQEIWDEIVDHLHGSPEDLKSSALVCRSFTYRAQSHIFRTINLVPPLIFAARSPDQTLQRSDARTSLVGSPGPSSRPSTTTLARRLRDLMALSSHLIVNVRTLHIGRGDEELLASIARIRWSRVHTLSLDLASYFHATTASTLNDIKTLVAMPSLRTMVFAGAFWDSAHLQNAFDHCNTALEHVRFWHCSPGYTPISTHTPTSNVQSSPRPKISSISLTFSPSVVDLLRHPACGLDFSNLTSMVCSQSFSPAFSSFVRCVGSTISHLYVPGKGAQRYTFVASSMSVDHDIQIEPWSI
jgi:hypothetical protein